MISLVAANKIQDGANNVSEFINNAMGNVVVYQMLFMGKDSLTKINFKSAQ